METVNVGRLSTTSGGGRQACFSVQCVLITIIAALVAIAAPVVCLKGAVFSTAAK